MRIYQSWLYNQLKSSYDTMRRKRWNASPKDYDFTKPKYKLGVVSSFVLMEAFLYDTYSTTLSEPRSIEYCVRLVEGWYDVLRVRTPEYFFKQLKIIVSLIRSNSPPRMWRERLDRSTIRLMVAPFVPLLVSPIGRTVRGFQARHAIACFFNKVPITRNGLEGQEIEAFLSCEESLDNTDWTVWERSLRGIITEWFGDFTAEDIHPSFSGGSTADCGSSLIAKISSKHYVREDTAVWLCKNYAKLAVEPPHIVFDSQVMPVAEVLFVPKNALHLRTISKEPAIYNYFQNGLNKAIVEYIEGSPALRQHIRLDRQDLSANMALRGSMDGRFATADLSAASDSVSLDLVKRVFRDVPALLEALLALRSTETRLPNGVQLTLRKFAPMGSSLCFTIETIVFSAICELACRMAGIPDWGRQYRVYGDDIVIDTRAFGWLITILSDLGFRINEEKSYGYGFFREACGVFAVKGVDITTPQLPRKQFLYLFGDNTGAAELLRFTDLANACYCVGYDFTRYVAAMEVLRRAHGNVMFYGYDPLQCINSYSYASEVCMISQLRAKLPEFWLYSDQPTNFQLKWKDAKIPSCNYCDRTKSYQTRSAVRLIKSVRSFKIEYSDIVFSNDGSILGDEAEAYSVKLYAMSHFPRSVVQGTDLELPVEIPPGEKYIDSPVVNSWVPYP